ncbi:MAG: extracellular solute-binding protein [Candidatus Omnitrophica bacterium]|nr:extracellular solute-binding protein [Candidatus Omnitrophota bacterium]MBU4303588.1 extracellular solute-binding protein [Candidatus Omnitrophota bacterium]MBU4467714.1 extracellular solute-binding protein [Candidatus Omnitrophota bacterium]MCG2707450.1 extracellular solute-binding protein [Candidatus Omnitrophota bacterium]
MKNIIISLLIVSFLSVSGGRGLAQDKVLEGTVILSGAWAIYPTVVAWAEAFQKIYPKVKIDVSAGGAGKGAADAIAGLVDIGMVSRDPDPAEIKKGITPIYILHDAVFPVTSDKNPALAELLKKGVKLQSWIDIYAVGLITTWDQVIGSKVDKKIHIYTRSDSCGAAQSWAAYLGKKQEDLKGIGIYGDPGLLEAAKRDPIGLGYNNFSYIFTREGTVVSGARIVPIDSNENGIADSDEIYTSREAAIKAIRAGRYPATRKNYFFVKGKPNGLVKEFIEFALSEEGAKIVDDSGASLSLPAAEREKILRSLE